MIMNCMLERIWEEASCPVSILRNYPSTFDGLKKRIAEILSQVAGLWLRFKLEGYYEWQDRFNKNFGPEISSCLEISIKCKLASMYVICSAVYSNGWLKIKQLFAKLP